MHGKMVVQIKKLFDKYFINNLITTIFVFSFGVFINRGLSIEPISLGVYFDELSMMLPEVSNHRFPQRILLPLISYLTGINVQILNIIILFVFIFSISNYLLIKQSGTISFFVTLMVATTMVFQFHIIYGGYPDALSLLLYFLAIKNTDSKKFYFFVFLSLLTREAALVMFPVLYLIKIRNNKKENVFFNLVFLIIIYLPIYFLLQQGGNENNANGWEFYLIPLIEDPLFWFNKSTDFYWLGLFSALKFLLLLIPLIIKSKKDLLLIVVSLLCVNIQFLVSGGDNTRYWLIFVIPILYLVSINLKESNTVLAIASLVVFLNIITPKYYVFTDAYAGGVYVTPNNSKIHIFDIYAFFNN
jgi:hypothetical protein